MTVIKTVYGEEICSTRMWSVRRTLESKVQLGVWFRHASLRGTDLIGADLRRGSFEYADLRGSDLRHADISRANFTGANLEGCNLANANMSWAKFRYTRLVGANFGDKPESPTVDLTGANLDGCNLVESKSLPVPVVKNLHRLVMESVVDGENLEMGYWHGECGSKHCRAGWAITLAGDAGKALEKAYGAPMAGSLIYWVSTKKIPDFYTRQDLAMEDIIACAEREDCGT